jgi:signal transduction histidine kinase/Na+/proline symporter
VTGLDHLRTPRDIAWQIGLPIVALLLLFTIVFGIRRISPTERHPGMMVAIAAESAVKLVAFVAAGAFVTYGLFDGFSDVLGRAIRAPPAVPIPEVIGGDSVATWLAHVLLSAAAIFLLPRQFHVAVVENTDDRQIRTAMWLFPAYLLVINLFVVPVALGGLLLGRPASAADTFVLAMPHEAGAQGLAWLVFLGGFSAGTGMVLVETMALSTMISNHLVLPAARLFRPLRGVRRHLLESRWAAATALLALSFAYERAFGGGYELVSIGLLSFSAVLQFAPAVLGGLFWRGASMVGAGAGLGAGFAAWLYTLVVPVLVRAGWLPAALLTEGPAGIAPLRPEALFGVGGLDRISHAVLWSMLFNVGAFVFGSLLFPATTEEELRSTDLLEGLAPSAVPAGSARGEPIADAAEKRVRITSVLAEYHDPAAADRLARASLARVGATDGPLNALQLADLQAEVEAALASSIGTASAHAALRRHPIVSPEEAEAISRAYAEILAELRVPPAEMRRKIDYHQERERLLMREAAAQRFLAEVSARLAASLDLETTARTVVHLPVPDLVEAALLWVADEEGGPPRAFVAHADPERERLAVPAIARASREIAGLTGVSRAMASRRPVLNAGAAPGAWAAVAPLEPFSSDVTLPLVGRHGALGTLSLFTSERSGIRLPQDLPLVEELAHLSAVALENAALYHSAEEAVRARDEFLAVASHELKTPLTPLQLHMQSLSRLATRGELAALPPERLLKLFRGAEGQVRRITGLVNDLLDVSRITSGRFRLNVEHADLAVIVREAVERHRGEIAAAGCAVSLELPPILAGRWDPNRLDQVVTNLLTNALKYASGAPVVIRASGDDTSIRLEVRDRGPGIPAPDQDRIFLPFERAVTYLRVSGFGLGLYIVRQIVEAHGGVVRLESVPGQGSAFIVELPRLTGRAASA